MLSNYSAEAIRLNDLPAENDQVNKPFHGSVYQEGKVNGESRTQNKL